MAHHYGLTETEALASVTSVPAKAMGLDHRIGKIALGMDADVVVWERHPLSLGSHPLQVYIDGVAQFKDADPTEWSIQGEPLEFKQLPNLTIPKTKDACSTTNGNSVFTGVKKIFLKGIEEFSQHGDLSVVIEDNEVVCTGRCQHHLAKMSMNVPVYDLGGEGVVLPSMLSVGTPLLGLQEISLEPTTGDGIGSVDSKIAHAVDGLKFGGLHMEEAYKAGILIGVTAPASEHIVQGVSVAFSTGAEDGRCHFTCVILQLSGFMSTRTSRSPVHFFSSHLEHYIPNSCSLVLVKRNHQEVCGTACQDWTRVKVQDVPHRVLSNRLLALGTGKRFKQDLPRK